MAKISTVTQTEMRWKKIKKNFFWLNFPLLPSTLFSHSHWETLSQPSHGLSTYLTFRETTICPRLECPLQTFSACFLRRTPVSSHTLFLQVPHEAK